MTRSVDRRAARTRKALYDALVALTLRKDYAAITVQDILDEADVGRSTFYSHYTGKGDLLRSGFEGLRSAIAAARASAPASDDGRRKQPLAFSLALFEHACANKQIYRALAGSLGGDIAAREIRRILADAVRKDLAASEIDGVPPEIGVRFVVDVFLNVLSYSLGRRPGVPPSDMNAMFRQLAIDGLASAGRRPVVAPLPQRVGR